VNLKPAPLETTDLSLPINFATALRLADARPLVVAAAQASAWVAEAQLQRAKVLWVPEFDCGAIYYRHDGFGPDFNLGVNHPAYGIPGPGGPLNQNLNYFYGSGAFYLIVAVTDAIYSPLSARQVLDSRRLDIQAAKNDALLATADAYFSVHQYRGTYAGAVDVVERGHKLVERIELLSEDLVPRVEVNRVNRLLADMEQKAASAREEWRVSSANLTQVLRLDPRVVIIPLERDHLQITLIDPARALDDLIAIGVANRPEIASQRAQIRAAQVRIRQEKQRPLLPTILVTGFQTPGGMTTQFGIFGTGRGSRLDQWGMREDVSAQLVWQLDAFGLGNLARIKERRGEESEAAVMLFRMQDAVAAEVTETQARLQSAAVRVEQAERAMREAIINFEGNYEGLRQTKRFGNVLVQVYRPQEAAIALQHLKVTYDEYFATVADYNRAQFQMFHALGYPAKQVSSFQPPGDVAPVDTNRPSYLPTVRNGPPAATR
jgi:outer membrane protein TolC